MRQLSATVLRIQESERTASLGNRSRDAVSLRSGDPDVPTPRHVVEAMGDALEQGYTHYAPHQGDPELRAEIADRLSAGSEARWTTDDVAITNGGSGAIHAAIVALIDPGDQVLVPQPTFSLYADTARGVGAEVTFVPLTADRHLDVDALRAAAGPRAKMVVLCNPCNPTGVVYTRAELEELAGLCAERDLLLLVDEAYDHVVFDGREHVSAVGLPDMADRTLLVQTFSKTYSMTGWRLGFLAGRGGMARAGMIVHDTAVGQVNAAVQRAGLVALRGSGDWTARMLEEYTRRRSLMCELLSAVDGLSWPTPEGTFHVLAKYRSPLPSRHMARFLLEHGVAVRSGSEFGPDGEGHIRISFTPNQDNIREGVRRLAAALAVADRAHAGVR